MFILLFGCRGKLDYQLKQFYLDALFLILLDPTYWVWNDIFKEPNSRLISFDYIRISFEAFSMLTIHRKFMLRFNQSWRRIGVKQNTRSSREIATLQRLLPLALTLWKKNPHLMGIKLLQEQIDGFENNVMAINLVSSRTVEAEITRLSFKF